MRKWLVGLVAVLGLSGVAQAADSLDPARARFGVTLAFGGSGIGVGGIGTFSINNLVTLAPNVGIGARADLNASFAGGFVGTLALSPVVTYDFGDGGVYAGPALGVGFGGGNVAFGFGLLGGVEYDLSPEFMLYSGANFIFGGGVLGNLFFGADYDLTRQFSVFAESRLGFVSGGAAFGLGLGAAYRF